MKHAFTLIELLLVLVLMAIVLGTAVANYSGTFEAMQLKKSADDLAHLMRYAQVRATMEGALMCITLSADQRQYQLQQADIDVDEQGKAGKFHSINQRLGRPVVLPKSVSLSSQVSSVNFYPDGSMDKVRITLKNKTGQMTLSSMEQRGHVLVFEQ